MKKKIYLFFRSKNFFVAHKKCTRKIVCTQYTLNMMVDKDNDILLHNILGGG